MKVEICRGTQQCDLEGKKKFSRLQFFLVVESAPEDGVGLVSWDVFLLEELVPLSWLMELDLLSLKGQCRVQQ